MVRATNAYGTYEHRLCTHKFAGKIICAVWAKESVERNRKEQFILFSITLCACNQLTIRIYCMFGRNRRIKTKTFLFSSCGAIRPALESVYTNQIYWQKWYSDEQGKIVTVIDGRCRIFECWKQMKSTHCVIRFRTFKRFGRASLQVNICGETYTVKLLVILFYFFSFACAHFVSSNIATES